jgi:hypothetical protein
MYQSQGMTKKSVFRFIVQRVRMELHCALTFFDRSVKVQRKENDLHSERSIRVDRYCEIGLVVGCCVLVDSKIRILSGHSLGSARLAAGH